MHTREVHARLALGAEGLDGSRKVSTPEQPGGEKTTAVWRTGNSAG